MRPMAGHPYATHNLNLRIYTLTDIGCKRAPGMKGAARGRCERIRNLSLNRRTVAIDSRGTRNGVHQQLNRSGFCGGSYL